MTAGFPLVMKFWREGYTISGSSTDDSIGGANPTGTIIYNNVEARIFVEKPTLALLEQGLETPKIFTANISALAVNVRENDIGEVVAPYNSWYFADKFRVIGVRHPSMGPSDPRGYVTLHMRRWEIAHANEQP